MNNNIIKGGLLVLSLIFFMFAILLIVPEVEEEVGPNFKNFYGIGWRGDPCDNLAYAEDMAYDYVMYDEGMETCELNRTIYFYLENPEFTVRPAYVIDINKEYTQSEIELYSSFFVQKSEEEFPNNLASGWWFSETTFRPNPDFQQQAIIDQEVEGALSKIRSLETENFKFGGYAWDVPDLTGDWWTGRSAKKVGLSYWHAEGLDSGVGHDMDYATYSEGRTQVMAQLFQETLKEYPNMKILYEPYVASEWNEIAPEILMPAGAVIICQESTKDLTGVECSTTPNVFGHEENLAIAGELAMRNGWFSWYGRFGGTGDMPNYDSISEVPDRLKYVRLIPGWDNLNGATNREWDGVTYKSSHSYIDSEVIKTTHPLTGELVEINIE